MAALLALPVSAETLKIGGTGSSASLVERLFEEFRKQVPDAELFQPLAGAAQHFRVADAIVTPR